MSGNRVAWTPEKDRRMMLWLITTTPKDIDFGHIAEKIPNATPKAIMERMSKLVRERKAIDAADGSTPGNKSTTGEGKITAATYRAAIKAGTSGKGSGKRKRVQEEDDGQSDDGVELKSVEKKEEEDIAAANDGDGKKQPDEFPMPTSARAKAISKKLKLAAEKKKTGIKDEGEEEAGVGLPVRAGKSKKNAKKEDAEGNDVAHASVEDEAKEENIYEGYEIVG